MTEVSAKRLLLQWQDVKADALGNFGHSQSAKDRCC